VGAGAEVFVRQGRLHIRLLTPIPDLYRGFMLHASQADPDVFRLEMPGLEGADQHVVFGRDASGAVTSLHLELMPVSLAKQPALTNPRRWAIGLLAGLGLASAIGLRRGRAQG
jgi:hypothetical protein